ncbi:MULTISPECIES: SDR family oxidoreductase [unclassified Cyanobium]|uniref:dTDP-4-dehydrorhamnose reductase family protein n=1 Tax=unclassified Cyanobium TaxID=2627006 RepID=UPI0020CCA691|nr:MULTISPECIES: SDR family oxidoreductase [unclassified Cyanobium]MCP9861150.1 SDR family oxidoreductase [Cyanobium sp. Cruz-8H5]MCP9868413.1 SDR family oxidoreductase [Cyanobium sp. Cruz-8D1]
MANVLVTGATGLLGSTLVPLLLERGHHITRLGHTHDTDLNADLISFEQTASALDQARPEVIINLAALTNVDRCELHPQEAYLLNVKPVENLCAWIQAAGQLCHLIQISSDQVYDGAGPHAEGKLTIRNHYAMSKLAGEFAAGIVASTILRTNFVGRSLRKGRTSFTDWLHCALLGTAPINVFDDVMFSPLFIGTLCSYIDLSIVERPLGVFNLGSRDGMSKADFAFAFAATTSLPTTNLIRSNARDVATVIARRPTDMRMRCERFEARMGLTLPRLNDEIQLLAHEYP